MSEHESPAIRLHLFPGNGQVKLETIAIGAQPVVILKPVLTNPDDKFSPLELQVLASLISQEELAGILSYAADVIGYNERVEEYRIDANGNRYEVPLEEGEPT